jgi:AcrB/AcrD/AcrF family protein
VLALALRGLPLDIFGQIGLLLLVGLAAKNSILLVSFAKELREQGRDALSAAQEAVRLRMRPILMTSFAFILGVVPLMTAAGAGAEMRAAIGTAVFFGMLGVTAFGLLFTPVFYVAIRRVLGCEKLDAPGTAAAAAPGPQPAGWREPRRDRDRRQRPSPPARRGGAGHPLLRAPRDMPGLTGTECGRGIARCGTPAPSRPGPGCPATRRSAATPGSAGRSRPRRCPGRRRAPPPRGARGAVESATTSRWAVKRIVATRPGYPAAGARARNSPTSTRLFSE